MEPLPQDIAESLKQATADHFGVAITSLQLTSANWVVWSDGSCGLAEPEQMYTMACVPGWVVTLTDGQCRWVYHTTGGASHKLNVAASTLPSGSNF